jgi:surfactin synthase thioesterase subunit
MKAALNQKVSKWVTINLSKGMSKGRLFCLPYAGGGAIAYHAWKDRILVDYDLVQVHLPGREARLREPPATNVTFLVDALAEELISLMDQPFCVFGHSMGALVSFELVRALKARYGVQPCHLFVSGYRAPQLPPREIIWDLPDAQFVQCLRDYGGIPDLVLKNPELMDIFLPVFRADFKMLDTYTYHPGEPLTCPITAFGGESDSKVSREEIMKWQAQTVCEFDCHLLPGGHFFISETQDQLISYVCDGMSRSFNRRQTVLRSLYARKHT